jgi:DNA-binding transcriptional ArsR family regulator
MNVSHSSAAQSTGSGPGKSGASIACARTKITKLDILRLLASLPGLNAAQVADRLRVSPEASGMLLLRLMRAGLLLRDLEHGVFVYTMTAKGHARYTFLAHRPESPTE